jgi:hypothetical protein
MWSAGWSPTGEAVSLAERLLADVIANQHIGPNQLTIHADRAPR